MRFPLAIINRWFFFHSDILRVTLRVEYLRNDGKNLLHARISFVPTRVDRSNEKKIKKPYLLI